MRTYNTYLTLIIFGVSLLAGCEEEKPPRSVTEFLDNPIMLEAAMVRCSQDRVATRYDAECINARQAVRQIQAKEEATQKEDLDKRSESKRQALRRTQEAAAQARRRSAEAQRLREETEYLAQFGVAPPTEMPAADDEENSGNLPTAVIPEAAEDSGLSNGRGDVLPATDGGNAPGIQAEPEEDPKTELESIRDELQRRNEETGN